MTHKDQTEEFLKSNISSEEFYHLPESKYNPTDSMGNANFLPRYTYGQTVVANYSNNNIATNIAYPKLKFKKIRDVKSPVRGTERSAGIDFFIPEYNELKDILYKHCVEYVTGTGVLRIEPKEDILIPSGIKVEIPKGYALIAFNKSGIATKKKLSVGACVIDEDYQGEIHIHLINQSLQPQYINPGDKAVQFILVPIAYMELEEDNNIHQEATQRGEGGFGSTGQ